MAVETLTNVAADLNLVLMQGKYWSSVLTIRDASDSPLDVTGYTFRGHVRQTAAGELVASFAFTPVDEVNGVVRVELLSAETAALTLPRYVYDWEYQDDDGEEHALIKGTLSVVVEVTHV